MASSPEGLGHRRHYRAVTRVPYGMVLLGW
jgi:hypothetical protein